MTHGHLPWLGRGVAWRQRNAANFTHSAAPDPRLQPRGFWEAPDPNPGPGSTARKMERVSVGVFRLAIAPLEAAGGAGPGADVQAPAAADGIVQDIQALRR
jgi:hypothetical protein